MDYTIGMIAGCLASGIFYAASLPGNLPEVLRWVAVFGFICTIWSMGLETGKRREAAANKEKE